MKLNKTISIDVDLAASLDKLGLNVSKYCNEKLWDYVTKLEQTEDKMKETEEEIENAIDKLKIKKESIERDRLLVETRKEAGMTNDKLKFLRNMSTNIMVAKDMPLAWENKFGERLTWTDMRAMKQRWT